VRGAVPVGDHEFATLMAQRCPVPEGAPVAVAVSGGGDSMALVCLAARWARSRGSALCALTVDHGLRPESRTEAEQVGVWLAARDVAHVVLPWIGPKPTTGLQAAARAARYRLIGAWGHAHGVAHCLLAHQVEDQAETFLMRAARGSGVSGLASMRDVTVRDGMRLLRPLLGVARDRLRATLERDAQDWIEDPSNESPRFARTRYRRLVATLDMRGVDSGRIAGLAEKMARLDALLDAAARMCGGACVAHLEGGRAAIDASTLRAMPQELGLLVLRRTIAEVGGRAQPPRGDRLGRALERACSSDGKAFTLGGCRIALDSDRILVTAESRPRRNEGFRNAPIGL
jgi:tRNA(Ile)-lysidine synthase